MSLKRVGEIPSPKETFSSFSSLSPGISNQEKSTRRKKEKEKKENLGSCRLSQKYTKFYKNLSNALSPH